jgi:hypothetical protein
VFAHFEAPTEDAGSLAGLFTQWPTTHFAATTPPLVCQQVSEFWIEAMLPT